MMNLIYLGLYVAGLITADGIRWLVRHRRCGFVIAEGTRCRARAGHAHMHWGVTGRREWHSW